jgi:hypothetical protein
MDGAGGTIDFDASLVVYVRLHRRPPEPKPFVKPAWKFLG